MQQDLANPEKHVLNSTMAVIVALVMVSVFIHDVRTAVKHMEGSHRLVQL